MRQALKPYAVYGRADVSNGYWLDGGLQNNFPLHAFDTAPDGPLNPGTLGVRLEESAQPIAAFAEDLTNAVDISLMGLLLTHLGGMLNTALYPSEGGQIRTPQEQAQTVTISIPGDVLSTLSFAPDRAKASEAILTAFDAVAKYFVAGFTPASSAHGSSADPQILDLQIARVRLHTKLVTG